MMEARGANESGRARLPYSCQSLDGSDIRAVIDVLESEWLTTGPAVDRFERALAERGGARHAVALSSGTAALHAAYSAAGVGPGTEVVVPPLTFSATANVAVHLGARVRFADVSPDTLTIDPVAVERLVTPETRAVVAVDFGGHPADLDQLRVVTDAVGAVLIEDAAHSLGARYKSKPVGSVADLTCFSFHPVKAITTGEGGAVLTDDAGWAQHVRRFRNHGIVRDRPVLGDDGAWVYDLDSPAFNYRLTDLQCALGFAQLERLSRFIECRREIVARYRELLDAQPGIDLPVEREWCTHAYHLFAIRIPADRRTDVFRQMRSAGVGVQVHYIPVNAFSAYRRLGYSPEDTPVALEAYRRLLSIPCHQRMDETDVERVVERLRFLLNVESSQ